MGESKGLLLLGGMSSKCQARSTLEVVQAFTPAKAKGQTIHPNDAQSSPIHSSTLATAHPILSFPGPNSSPFELLICWPTVDGFGGKEGIHPHFSSLPPPRPDGEENNLLLVPAAFGYRKLQAFWPPNHCQHHKNAFELDARNSRNLRRFPFPWKEMPQTLALSLSVEKMIKMCRCFKLARKLNSILFGLGRTPVSGKAMRSRHSMVNSSPFSDIPMPANAQKKFIHMRFMFCLNSNGYIYGPTNKSRITTNKRFFPCTPVLSSI